MATLTGLPYHVPAIGHTWSASVLSYSQEQARAVFTALFTCFIVTFAAFLLQCMQRFAREYDKCLMAKSQRRRRAKNVIRHISEDRKVITGRGVLPWDDILYSTESPKKENTPFSKQSVNGSLSGRKSSEPSTSLALQVLEILSTDLCYFRLRFLDFSKHSISKLSKVQTAYNGQRGASKSST